MTSPASGSHSSAGLASSKKTRRRPPTSTPSPLAGLNQQVLSALLLLLFLFAFVTFAAIWRLPTLEDGSNQHVSLHIPNLSVNHARLQEMIHQIQTKNSSSQTMSHQQQPDQHVHLEIIEEHKDVNQHDIDAVRQKFPIMVGDDMEEIFHPGILYSKRKAEATKMMVPKFWDSPAYGAGGVRQYLGNYGERLPTPQEAANVGSWYGDVETIYISVASYRDPECGITVESILARAKFPRRVRVALIDQRTDGDPKFCGPPVPCEQDPTQAYCIYMSQIDTYHVDARLAVGPVFARHLAHRMYRGEYFAMQVDSHIRFIQDWDDDIIWQWKSARNEMAVLTTYLSDLIGSIDPITHKNTHPERPIMCKSDYEGRGKMKHLRHGQQPEGRPGITGQPTLHPFWAAGFSFARAHFVVQVPYDQYLPMVFQGEEISMGLRGFTYGYDYYAAERSVCFHMYAIKENKKKREAVNLFWENTQRYQGADVEAMKRLNGIIGMGDPTDTFDHTDEKKYGLGQIRTTKKFFDTFGIHTDTQTVEKGLCSFVGKPMMSKFQPFLRTNRMGIDYNKIEYKFEDPHKARTEQIERVKKFGKNLLGLDNH